MSRDDIKIMMRGSTEEIDYEITSSSGIKRHKVEHIEGLADKIERKHLTSGSEMVRR